MCQKGGRAKANVQSPNDQFDFGPTRERSLEDWRSERDGLKMDDDKRSNVLKAVAILVITQNNY